ncbi:MAG: 1-acyl-sn-glycerol-3-phosphate acyltransferase [Planctomycetes bacterium]|nr:1-acyl-sn-glycerol-3-phosphate acyltransferase [Planctomycetota bacterium]
MNRQPYAVPPKWWAPRMSPRWVRATRGWRAWRLRRAQRVLEVHADGWQHVQGPLSEGKGVLITPNHSAHYDSAALYLAADQVDLPLYFMTAWQVFGMSSRFDQWAMQRLGCFSIDREGVDRQAFKQAVRVLQNEPYPLVVFPEGDIYHTSDRVTPFREGAAAIALMAAKRGERPVVAVPCGIKFRYVDDPTGELVTLADELEERVLLRPAPDRPLPERVHRIAEAVLALKELDFLGHTRSGRLRDRIPFLTQSVLRDIEERHGIAWDGDESLARVPERVKQLRQKLIDEMQRRAAEEAASGGKPKRLRRKKAEYRHLTRLSRDGAKELGWRERMHLDMDDIFFVMQCYSYPGDYLVEKPNVERMAETLDKFEEDILQLDLPRVRGTRRVAIRFGEPLAMQTEKGKRTGADELTETLQGAVQRLIDDLNAGE